MQSLSRSVMAVLIGAGVDISADVSDQVIKPSVAFSSYLMRGMTIGSRLENSSANRRNLFNGFYIANTFDRKQNCTAKRCFRGIDKCYPAAENVRDRLGPDLGRMQRSARGYDV